MEKYIRIKGARQHNLQNIDVNISASDSLSGLKRIKLPNGNYVNNSLNTYNR